MITSAMMSPAMISPAMISQVTYSSSSSGSANPIALVIGLLMILLIFSALISLWGLIFKKAGYSFWLGLLMIIPLVNLVWIIVFACSKWPVLQEVEMLRGRAGYGTGGFPVGQPGFPPQGPGTVPPPLPPGYR
jgi:hypothetical protein